MARLIQDKSYRGAALVVRRLRLPEGGLTTGQKSAEGILGHDVGKASEALRKPKGGAMDRPSRKRGRRPEREGEASRP
jgi:hypothetical protein